MVKKIEPVRMFVPEIDHPLIKSILNYFSASAYLVYVGNSEDADLVVFTEVEKIKKGYNLEKTYAFIDLTYDDERPDLPKGCLVVDSMNIILGLTSAVTQARSQLTSRIEILYK